MYSIALILMLQQPGVYEALIRIYRIPRLQLWAQDVVIVEIVSDDLTKEQKELRRLMMIKPNWDRREG